MFYLCASAGIILNSIKNVFFFPVIRKKDGNLEGPQSMI